MFGWCYKRKGEKLVREFYSEVRLEEKQPVLDTRSLLIVSPIISCVCMFLLALRDGWHMYRVLGHERSCVRVAVSMNADPNIAFQM